jgi:hypothetical protein
MENILTRIEVTEKNFNKGLEYINQSDKDWDEKEKGFRVIGITGRHQVYYTFWHIPRIVKGFGWKGPIYMGNLSTNFVEACKKAREKSGIQPIHIEDTDTIKSMAGISPEYLSFGKYRGHEIGEIFNDDPQYIIWMSKNFTAKNKKQKITQSILNELSDNYFLSMRNENLKNETKDFFGEVGEKIEVSAILKTVKCFDNEYGRSFQLRLENDNSRFMLYLTENRIINNKEKTTEDILKEQVSQSFVVIGKVKNHREIVGKKYTVLNYARVNDNDFSKI